MKKNKNVTKSMMCQVSDTIRDEILLLLTQHHCVRCSICSSSSWL